MPDFRKKKKTGDDQEPTKTNKQDGKRVMVQMKSSLVVKAKQNGPELVKHVQGARERAKRCMRMHHQGQILIRLIENNGTFLSVRT